MEIYYTYQGIELKLTEHGWCDGSNLILINCIKKLYTQINGNSHPRNYNVLKEGECVIHGNQLCTMDVVTMYKSQERYNLN